MNAYVDCGAYKGTYIRAVRQNRMYGPSYSVFAFECNPALYSYGYGEDVKVYRRAAWIFDGRIPLYINPRRPTIEGSSVYKDKITGALDPQHPMLVPCIDFSAWLGRTFTIDDHVVVKMNIEGAEYEVLDKCLKDGTVALIDELHIQWHKHKIPSISQARHDSVVEALGNAAGLKLYSGYGKLRS